MLFCTRSFPSKVNNIRGAIENVVKSENGDISNTNLNRLYFLVTSFLSKYGFGHDEDYVYIIDEKGMALKHAGSISAFEEHVEDMLR